MKFEFKHFICEDFWKHFAFMFFGILFMGITLSILVQVGWGTDTFSYMNLNIARALGWSLGNWQLLFNVILSVTLVIFGWNLVGFGTLFNMVCIGYTVDFCTWIWEEKTGFHQFITTCPLGVKIAVFAAAVLAFIIVASIYMNAEMGLSPWDGNCKIVSDHFPKVPFFALRICWDFAAVLAGFIATIASGNKVDASIIGAIAMVVLLGPAITLVGKMMKPIFEKKDK